MEQNVWTKQQLVAGLKQQLATRQDQALKALVTLYSLQTSTEKRIGATQEENKVGFTGYDSSILSSLARQFDEREQLTEKQMAIVYKLIPKYASQLIELSIQAGKIKKLSRCKYTF